MNRRQKKKQNKFVVISSFRGFCEHGTYEFTYPGEQYYEFKVFKNFKEALKFFKSEAKKKGLLKQEGLQAPENRDAYAPNTFFSVENCDRCWEEESGEVSEYTEISLRYGKVSDFIKEKTKFLERCKRRVYELD